MFDRFNHNAKYEWSTGMCYNIHEHWKHPKRNKLYRKGYLGHTHLVSFIFIKVVKMRKSLKNTSRKENWFRMEKDIFILWGRWWMWKWACELDSKVKTIMISHLGVMQVLPGRLSLIRVKHSECCHLNWHMR